METFKLYCIGDSHLTIASDLNDILNRKEHYLLYVYDRNNIDISGTVFYLDIENDVGLLAPVVRVVYLIAPNVLDDFIKRVEEIQVNILYKESNKLTLNLQVIKDTFIEKNFLEESYDAQDTVAVTQMYSCKGVDVLRERSPRKQVKGTLSELQLLLKRLSVKVQIDQAFKDLPTIYQDTWVESDTVKQILSVLSNLRDTHNLPQILSLKHLESKSANPKYRTPKQQKVSTLSSIMNDARIINPVRFAYKLDGTVHLMSLRTQFQRFEPKPLYNFIASSVYQQLEDNELEDIITNRGNISLVTIRDYISEGKYPKEIYCNYDKQVLRFALAIRSYESKFDITLKSILSHVFGPTFVKVFDRMRELTCGVRKYGRANYNIVHTYSGNFSSKLRVAANIYKDWYQQSTLRLTINDFLPDPRIFNDFIWSRFDILLQYKERRLIWVPFFGNSFRIVFARTNTMSPFMSTTITLILKGPYGASLFMPFVR